jgi:thioredoxin reductase (NADPH)
VDDDPQVLKVLKRDLTKRYGNRFRVLQARSGQKGFEIAKQLKLSHGIVALILADQRMPQMTGVEFLRKTMDIFPDAKRVLLTDYGDTEAVMKSINKVNVDYYLMKPWHPSEVHLYPHLNDLLDDWWISFRPPFEGIKVIGLRWSPRSHETKEFLARNGIPYQWLDIEDSKEARRLVSSAMINTKSQSSISTLRFLPPESMIPLIKIIAKLPPQLQCPCQNLTWMPHYYTSRS